MAYFSIEPSAEFPLGRLGKEETQEIFLYAPETETWELCPSAAGSTPENSGKRTPLADEDARYLQFRLQVAEQLTHMFGNSYHHGRNFEWVAGHEKDIRWYYDDGEDPDDAAAFVGYCCG